jgi:hypothetical protein
MRTAPQNAVKEKEKRMSKVSPRLKIVKSDLKPRLGGLPAPDSMKPGRYLVKCETAILEPYGKTFRVTWQFIVYVNHENATAENSSRVRQFVVHGERATERRLASIDVGTEWRNDAEGVGDG